MQGCHLKLPINVIARPFSPAFRSPNKSTLSEVTATKFSDKFQKKKSFYRRLRSRRRKKKTAATESEVTTTCVIFYEISYTKVRLQRRCNRV